MGKLRVLKAGFFTTIQDMGRFGYRKFGVPVSGAMDSKSMMDANFLVGNRKDAPILECTLNGGKFQFLSNALVGISGAQCEIILNGKVIRLYESISVEKGDVLELGYPTRGCRAYLAIKGELEIPKVMGSYSTNSQGKFGGFDGRALQKGDVLSWRESDEAKTFSMFPKDQIPYFSSKINIPIKQGPEFGRLTDEARKTLFNSKFEVQSQSNRMGVRLKGVSIKMENVEMSSSPVKPGVIQLPTSGNPIILMNDGQTIGGYPRIAVVQGSELWRVGQVKTGDQISFQEY